MAKTIKTGEVQRIPLPPLIPNTTNEEKAAEADQTIMRQAKMAYIGKRAAKLEGDLKKRFAIVYDQCSEAVKSRLGSTED